MRPYVSAHRARALHVAGALLGAAVLVAVAVTGPASFATTVSAARPRTVTIRTPPKSAAVAALVPASVKAKGSVTVAMDTTYAPDEFLSTNGKTIIGMDADFNAAIGAVMGIKWNPVNVTFDNIIPGLQSKKFDVGNSSFTIKPSREKVVNFVTYFQAGEGYYVKSSSSLKLQGLKSLCGHSVAVESGTTEQTDAQNTAKVCKKDGKQPDSVQSYPNQNEANLAISSGREQIGFVDSQVAGYIVQVSKGRFKLAGSAFEVAPYGIIFPKSSQLDKATLAAVKVLMKDGVYQEILKKWGVQAGAITNPAIN